MLLLMKITSVLIAFVKSGKILFGMDRFNFLKFKILIFSITLLFLFSLFFIFFYSFLISEIEYYISSLNLESSKCMRIF